MSLAGRTHRVSVLGGLGVHPAERLSGAGRRVLAYLAVRSPRALRSLLCMELWPNMDETRARANLRRALWQLPAGWVEVDGPDLVLDAEVDYANATEVAARAIGGELLPATDLKLLLLDLLPGWYDEWLREHQEQFHLRRVQALEETCRRATATGDLCTATSAGLSAVTAEPLRESAVTALVAAHLCEGNRADAARRYHAYAALLQTELRCQPGPELQALLSGVS